MRSKFNFSRRQKNLVLIALNLLALLINLLKVYLFNTAVSISVNFWMWAVLVVVLINVLPKFSDTFSRFGHILLFISMGTIFGLTLGSLIVDSRSLIIPEYIWLVLAIIGIFIHYSRSTKDIYLNP